MLATLRIRAGSWRESTIASGSTYPACARGSDALTDDVSNPDLATEAAWKQQGRVNIADPARGPDFLALTINFGALARRQGR